jgi:sarcosine oxidase subunit alpha
MFRGVRIRMISLFINDARVGVKPGTSVAVAILIAGCDAFRTSVSGQPRGPLCGMGVCFECRVTVNGLAHARSCQIVCEEGMQVLTT